MTVRRWLPPADVKAELVCVFLALLIVAAGFIGQFGTLTMKRIFAVAALAAVAVSCLALSGCASATGNATELLSAIEKVNAGCSKTVEVRLSYVAPMPPAGSVNVTKTCGQASATGDSAPAASAPTDAGSNVP